MTKLKKPFVIWNRPWRHWTLAMNSTYLFLQVITSERLPVEQVQLVHGIKWRRCIATILGRNCTGTWTKTQSSLNTKITLKMPSEMMHGYESKRSAIELNSNYCPTLGPAWMMVMPKHEDVLFDYCRNFLWQYLVQKTIPYKNHLSLM